MRCMRWVGSIGGICDPISHPFYLFNEDRTLSNAIIRRFKINALYGYKDVEIKFEDNLLILIAGNGSGKTTILNALHAFLRRRFHRLQSLEFSSIECDFSDPAGSQVILRKEQIGAITSDAYQRMSDLADRAGIPEEDLYEFLQSEHKSVRSEPFYRQHAVVQSLFTSTPMDYDEIRDELDEIHSALFSSDNSELKEIGERVASALKDVEILYLPTYRRIENPLLSPRGKLRRSLHPSMRRKAMSKPATPDQLNFGLEDVETRLAQLSEEVERTSNLEYRNASATIIDDALEGRVKPGETSTEGLPELEPLKRFLSRVARDPRIGIGEVRPRALMDEKSEKRISAISDLYEKGAIADDSQSLLRYFLTRLGLVIEKTKETEAMLQRFVEACNGYFSDSSDEKLFTYDPNLMRVAVINSWTESEIPLSQLSSGEKQIVSILAKLYLYDKQKLVLIDEPELSLSIDWQKRILPDMLRSGSVCQLLAITHSPFVFDNELDPFAGSLNVEKHRPGTQNG